eukprot:scaffold170914_cov35-Attheya_sp.AAC.1
MGSGCRFTINRGLFVTHGQKSVRVCPCDVRAHRRTRDAIWPDCVSCPVRPTPMPGALMGVMGVRKDYIDKRRLE